MRRYDLISTGFLMLLAIYVAASGVRLGFGEWREPGPGFLPVLFGGLLGGLAAIWFAMALVKRWGDDGAARRFITERDGLTKVLLTLAALAAFAYLLERVGFVLVTFAFMVFLLRAIEPQPWRRTLVLSVATTLLCYVVFQVWLQVQFPEGPMSLAQLRGLVF